MWSQTKNHQVKLEKSSKKYGFAVVYEGRYSDEEKLSATGVIFERFDETG